MTGVQTCALPIFRHIRIVSDVLRKCALEGDLVIAAIHDVALAINLADTAFVLRNGDLVLAGQSSAVLSPSSLGDVFGVDLAWATDDGGKRHLVSP